MFQRFFYSIFLSLTLLFSNLGLALNIHYCGTSIEKIALGFVTSMSCNDELEEEACCSETPSESDCCKNEIIKQGNDEVIAKVFSSYFSSDFTVPTNYEFRPLVVNEQQLLKKIDVAFYCESNAPPLYKLYHQFLFYA